jgi:MoaA/NifB/PqqE/SkfB family radical SAM enzyme
MVYEWAENLTFGETGTIRKYIVHNLDFSDQHISWTIDKTAMIEIPIEKTSTGLILSFFAKPKLIHKFISMQNINIAINDYSTALAFEASKNDFNEYFIYIDKQFIENEKTIKIIFSIPEAIICLQSMRIDKLTLAHSSDESINRNFCALPWMFITLAKNGIAYLCPRNPDPIENWFNNDLNAVWNSSKMVTFREAISHGYYPNKYCKRCHLGGGCDTSFKKFFLPLTSYVERLNNWCVINIKDKSTRNNVDAFVSASLQLKEILHLKQHNARSLKTVRQMDEYVNCLHHLRHKIPHFRKIELLLRQFDSYLKSDSILKLNPLFRNVTLIDKCNSNCIHCLRKYTVDSVDDKQLSEKHLKTALGDLDYLNFFLAGTEFLLYKHWKKVIKYFRKADVKFELSSNGILLTKENIKYIIDSDTIGFLNISLDGARKETIEYIRRNVNFEKVTRNIKELFSLLVKKKLDIPVSLSFVCMKQNIDEAAEFVSLCDKLRTCENGKKYKRVSVVFQRLEDYAVEEYSDFYKKSYIDIFNSEHNSTLRSILNKSKVLDIAVFVYNISIEEAVQAGSRIVNRWLPQNTRRRRLYCLYLRSLVVLFKEGPLAFFQKIAARMPFIR